jgi:hypothetical protein
VALSDKSNLIAAPVAALVVVGVLGIILALERRDAYRNRPIEFLDEADCNAENGTAEYGVDDPARKSAGVNKNNRHYAQKTKHTWLERSTVAIAVLAFLAAAGQAWIARDTEKRSQRAYVLAEKAEAIVDTNNEILSRVDIKNSGLTPASDLRHWACVAIRPFKVKETSMIDPTDLPDWPGDVKELPSTLIGPGQTIYHNRPYICGSDLNNPRLISPSDVAAVHQSTKAIYLYGIVTYKDAFGDDHTTKFRFVTNESLDLSIGGMVTAANGNSAN